jgi:type IV pilus assembly protein PilA
MLPSRPVVVAGLLTLAMAGCGGDDSDEKKSSAEPSPQMTQQDDAAKTNARDFATEVETCFVDQQSYAFCKEPEGTQLPMGSGPGQVEVADATDTDYTVVAHSESGANFTVAKDATSGESTRSCDKPEKGGCKAGGTW